MLTITATMLLEQAIDQCSRAAEEDCRGAVVRLFCDLLSQTTRDVLDELAIDLGDIPATTDFSGAVVGKFYAQAIEAGTAETSGSACESAVGEADASERNHT